MVSTSGRGVVSRNRLALAMQGLWGMRSQGVESQRKDGLASYSPAGARNSYARHRHTRGAGIHACRAHSRRDTVTKEGNSQALPPDRSVPSQLAQGLAIHRKGFGTALFALWVKSAGCEQVECGGRGWRDWVRINPKAMGISATWFQAVVYGEEDCARVVTNECEE